MAVLNAITKAIFDHKTESVTVYKKYQLCSILINTHDILNLLYNTKEGNDEKKWMLS